MTIESSRGVGASAPTKTIGAQRSTYAPPHPFILSALAKGSKYLGSLSQGRWTRGPSTLPALTKDGSSRSGRSDGRPHCSLGGRSFSSDKNDRREAPNQCAGSPAANIQGPCRKDAGCAFFYPARPHEGRERPRRQVRDEVVVSVEGQGFSPAIRRPARSAVPMRCLTRGKYSVHLVAAQNRS